MIFVIQDRNSRNQRNCGFMEFILFLWRAWNLIYNPPQNHRRNTNVCFLTSHPDRSFETLSGFDSGDIWVPSQTWDQACDGNKDPRQDLISSLPSIHPPGHMYTTTKINVATSFIPRSGHYKHYTPPTPHPTPPSVCYIARLKVLWSSRGTSRLAHR